MKLCTYVKSKQHKKVGGGGGGELERLRLAHGYPE